MCTMAVFLLGIGDALENSLGDLGGLAQAVANGTLAVTDNHQGGELHDTAALHGLADTVQVNDLFNELGCFIVRSLIVSHFFSSSP